MIVAFSRSTVVSWVATCCWMLGLRCRSVNLRITHELTSEEKGKSQLNEVAIHRKTSGAVENLERSDVPAVVRLVLV